MGVTSLTAPPSPHPENAINAHNDAIINNAHNAAIQAEVNEADFAQGQWEAGATAARTVGIGGGFLALTAWYEDFRRKVRPNRQRHEDFSTPSNGSSEPRVMIFVNDVFIDSE